MNIKSILAIILMFSATHAFSTTLETLFEDHFYTLHIPNHCGQNILNFLKMAKAENIDLTGAEIIKVENGWVEPLYVRNQGYKPKAPGPAGLTYKPGPKYFDFHIFLIHDNRVYDFDYGNSPVVPSTSSYFKKMWITGKDRDRFLGLKTYPAMDYLAQKPMPTNLPVINLLKFVADRKKP